MASEFLSSLAGCHRAFCAWTQFGCGPGANGRLGGRLSDVFQFCRPDFGVFGTAYIALLLHDLQLAHGKVQIFEFEEMVVAV